MNYKLVALLTCLSLANTITSVEELHSQDVSKDIPSFEEYHQALSPEEQKEWDELQELMGKKQSETLQAMESFLNKKPHLMAKYYQYYQRPFNFQFNFEIVYKPEQANIENDEKLEITKV